MLALACLLPLAGCPSHDRAPAEAAALARTRSPLAWRVNHARITHHLATSSLESRDAMPGHQFIVLDVSVRNRDAQPQVLSEGKLIALDEANLQTFDQPETLLSDDYLSLQVLAPAQSLHGKIAYEVPEPLSGVLYWSPGNGSERILLNPVAAPSSTLANAEIDADAVTNAGDHAADARIAATHDTGSVAEATQARPAAATQPAPRPARRAVATLAPATSAPTSASTSPVVIDVPDATPLDVAANAPIDSTAVLPPSRVPPPQAATLAVSPSLPVAVTAVATHPHVANTSPGDRELARRKACEALVARDDAADKPGNLDFFAASCRDYRLPEQWRPQPASRPSLFARAKERASSLLARVMVAPRVVRVFGCDAGASPADKLVCANPNLSAMEHRLAQSFARASDHVDPVALQNEQEHWRGHVRDACGTARCLQQAYGRRIAQLDALAPMRP